MEKIPKQQNLGERITAKLTALDHYREQKYLEAALTACSSLSHIIEREAKNGLRNVWIDSFANNFMIVVGSVQNVKIDDPHRRFAIDNIVGDINRTSLEIASRCRNGETKDATAPERVKLLSMVRTLENALRHSRA